MILVALAAAANLCVNPPPTQVSVVKSNGLLKYTTVVYRVCDVTAGTTIYVTHYANTAPSIAVAPFIVEGSPCYDAYIACANYREKLKQIPPARKPPAESPR